MDCNLICLYHTYRSISMASIVDPVLKAATSNNTKRFTIFAPNDSFIMTMPKYGQDRLFSAASWNLLKSVSLINPHLPNGLSHPYQLDESIFHLRVCRVGLCHKNGTPGLYWLKDCLTCFTINPYTMKNCGKTKLYGSTPCLILLDCPKYSRSCESFPKGSWDTSISVLQFNMKSF